MSLFKAREWWSANCGNDEEFDKGCLCIGNIDNSADKLDKVIVGSFSGMLRLFSPNATIPSNGNENASGAVNDDSLLLEVQLAFPVLQLECGRFVASSSNLYLAVLHPRKLVVYGVNVVSAKVNHGSQYHMSLIYEHNLQRSAFSFVVGQFGKVKGRDFICVLSLDGTISIFEQESFSFSHCFPGVLVPGSFAYVERTDSFVTVSASYVLEAYKYQVLAVSLSSSSNMEKQSGMPTKKVQTDWTYNLGEAALDIVIISPKNSASLIYILGERHLFCLKETGCLKFMKKLEYQPNCFHVYGHGLNHHSIDGTVFIIVISSTGMLLVYQDVCLRWAAHLADCPVTLNRINFRGLTGGILLLSETGKLSCCYLGTNPLVYTPIPVEQREVDYERTDAEMAELHKIIKVSQKSGTPVAKQVETALSLSATVPTDFSSNQVNDDCSQQRTPCLAIKVHVKPLMPLENVRITFNFENSYHLTPSSHHISFLGEPISFSVTICLREGYVPSTLSGDIIAVYSSILGAPSVVKTSVTLPLKIALASCAPVKDADHKVTIGTNKPTVRLEDLFENFIETTNLNAVGFRYHGGPTVTLLLAKASQRYRIQSDSFEALSLIIVELISRLERSFSNSEGRLVFSCSSALPIQELTMIAGKHLQARQRATIYEKRLSQLAAQFRAIQKRLLSKLKDKTNADLANLDILLANTFKQIMQVTDGLEMHRMELGRLLCNLNAAASLFVILTKIVACLRESDVAMIYKVLCPHLMDESELGWEEVVSAGLNHLLKTMSFDNGATEVEKRCDLSMPDDTALLKKLIIDVVEALGKGTVVENPTDEVEFEKSKEFDESAAGDPASIPLGSQFGERQLQKRLSFVESRKTHSTKEMDVIVEKEEPGSPKASGYTNEETPDDTMVTKIPAIQTVSFDAGNTAEEF